MDWVGWIERFGEPAVLAACGLLAGLGFGFFAQRSRFCLRAAVIEFWCGKFGDKLTVWLLAFGSAVVGVQLLIVTGALDVSTARQLSARGSLSGALLGGIIFGAGMITTRGCASRLLVLSATGNLRALLSGLVFAVVAQAWWLTHAVSANSFEPLQIQGLTFSSPSAEWLMRALAEPGEPWTFGLGLMPGVLLGSLAGALVGGDWKIASFGGAHSMPRYIIGAVFMGFGSMLAGGCAVGAGMTGGATFAVTAWLTLGGMWIGGGAADYLLDRPRQALVEAPNAPVATASAAAP